MTDWTLVFTGLTTIFFAVTAALEVYHRLWVPRSQRRAVEKDATKGLLSSCKATLHNVAETTDTWRGFAPATLQQLQEFAKDARIPTALREKVDKIERNARYYDNLLREVESVIIGNLIDSETLSKTQLNERWARFGIGSLKNELKPIATVPILEGRLDTWQVKESLLEIHGRDRKLDLMDKPGGVVTETVRLKDLLDSQDFHELIDTLKGIQRLQFVEHVRTLRAGLRDDVQTAVKWIESGLQKQ